MKKKKRKIANYRDMKNELITDCLHRKERSTPTTFFYDEYKEDMCLLMFEVIMCVARMLHLTLILEINSRL